MASLRVSIPIGDGMELDRQDILLHIISIEEWYEALRSGCHRKLPYYEPRPAVLTGDNSTRRSRQYGPEERQINRKKDVLPTAKCSARERGSYVVENKELYGKNTPTLTSSLDSTVGSAQPEDVDSDGERIQKYRKETQEILEGRKQPAPNRQYSGDFARKFREMANREMEKEQESMPARRTLKGAPYNSDSPLRGWKFLREVILSKLDREDTQHFPPYHKSQRAFILTIEEIRGKARIYAVRNLDTCTMRELLRLMMRLEERGWQDVLWVSNSGDRLPSSVDLKGDAKDLVWETSEVI